MAPPGAWHGAGESASDRGEPVTSLASDSDMLVVGRDVDGGWTVREGTGPLLGRFTSYAAACRFAERQRRGRPAVQSASSAGSGTRLRGRLTLAGFSRTKDDADA